MYATDAATVVSLVSLGYVMLAIYLYFKHKKIWGNILQHIQENVPVSNTVLAFSMFLMVLFVPLIMFASTIKRILSYIGVIKNDQDREISEDAQYFLAQYYPEIEQNLEGVPVEVDRQELEPLLVRIAGLLSSGFGEPEIFRVKRTADYLLESDDDDSEEKLSFHVNFRGANTTIVIEMTLKKKDIFEITFYTSKELADIMDKEIDAYFDA